MDVKAKKIKNYNLSAKDKIEEYFSNYDAKPMNRIYNCFSIKFIFLYIITEFIFFNKYKIIINFHLYILNKKTFIYMNIFRLVKKFFLRNFKRIIYFTK